MLSHNFALTTFLNLAIDMKSLSIEKIKIIFLTVLKTFFSTYKYIMMIILSMKHGTQLTCMILCVTGT